MKLNYTLDAKNPRMRPLSYAHPGDSGMDLQANLINKVALTIYPGERALVPTGISVDLTPMGNTRTHYEAQVRPRSGEANRQGITVLNTPGTVDTGYIKEIFVNLYNTGKTSYTIPPGARIAQLVIVPLPYVEPIMVEEITTATTRGGNGHGSTGV